MHEYILLGSGHGRLYRVFKPSTETLSIARHVRCDETILPGYGDQSENFVDIRKVVTVDFSTPDINSSTLSDKSDCNPTTVQSTAGLSTGDLDVLTYIPSGPRQSERIAALSNGVTATVTTEDPDMPTVSNALSSNKRDQWIEAIEEELRALRERKTWELGPRPQQKKIMPCELVIKLKRRPDNTVDKCKACLVVQGFRQTPDDYDTTFSPVADFYTVRLILAYAEHRNLSVHHLDVANAFLYGDLKEELYMEQPRDFEDSVNPRHFCRLRKSL